MICTQCNGFNYGANEGLLTVKKRQRKSDNVDPIDQRSNEFVVRNFALDQGDYVSYEAFAYQGDAGGLFLFVFVFLFLFLFILLYPAFFSPS